ncbi:alpha-L-rhamnosidase C-terminal domain-containing protein [Streptomyces sp. NPDC048304]|uniref:alpha-L-rhamnosidase C-terminal domain-containing protein n=1 Tax=Streptomyces sp. NPDC048304 TaxID=3154820 RepID=UPI0033E0D56B
MGPAAPGYRALLVALQPGGGLTSASGTYQTPFGTAESNWTVSGGQLAVGATVP